MKKSKLILFALVAFMTLTAGKCNRSKDPVVNETAFSGDCPLERLDWMTVKTGYDSETLSKLAASLKVAAQADLSQINKVIDGSASVDGGFNSSLEQLIKGKAETIVIPDITPKVAIKSSDILIFLFKDIEYFHFLIDGL